MLKDLFRGKKKYVTVKSRQSSDVAEKREKEIPDGLWTKCEDCRQMIYNKELAKNLHICTKCGYHFRVGARDRLNQIVDDESFSEYDSELQSVNPLSFTGYEEKIDKAQKKVNMNDAVITGDGIINGNKVVIALTDFSFMAGSMGSVVGEKVTRAAEQACEKKIPFVSISSGGGGARMYEGTISLMQMAKTSGAIARLNQAGILYISVLCDPTMGGIFASFASLGDVNIAEPGALIGFAGPRVVAQTKEKLPPEFQRAEFLLDHGMIDMIVHRKDLKNTLGLLLKMHI